jgi:hypothetical protein
MADAEGDKSVVEAKVPDLPDAISSETNSVDPSLDENNNEIHGIDASIVKNENGGEDGDKNDSPSPDTAQNPPNLNVETTKPKDETPTAVVFSSNKAWSETLKSPKIPEFSPSLNPNRPKSLHGLGKQASRCRSVDF